MDWFIIAVALAIYFLPWLVAARRNHRQRSAICVMNFLLGWTFIGWAIALIWACSESRQEART